MTQKLLHKICYTEIQLKSALTEHDNLKITNANLKEQLDEPVTLSNFYSMCNTIFAAKLAMCSFIKSQARLLMSKGKRYIPEDKQFALMDHVYGAKVLDLFKNLGVY